MLLDPKLHVVRKCLEGVADGAAAQVPSLGVSLLVIAMEVGLPPLIAGRPGPPRFVPPRVTMLPRGDGLSRPRPQARPPRSAQGAPRRAPSRARPRALPPRDPHDRPARPSAYPAGVGLGGSGRPP